MFGRKKTKHGNKTLHYGLDASQHNGIGVPWHAAYGYRSLPGSGANQWAWLTELLPTYPPAGLGIPNGAKDPAEPNDIILYGGQIVGTPSGPVLNVVQGAVLYLLGDPGTAAGQFSMQPLTDSSPASPDWFLAEPMIGETQSMAMAD